MRGVIMGRIHREYCLVLVMILSMASVVSAQHALASRATLKTCECWAAPDETSLQVGKVVLHFSDNPMVHPLPSTIYTKKNDHIFFIPAADVSADQLRTILDVAKKNNNKWYSLSISLEQKPIAGIKIVFTCDPDKVSIEHRLFDILGTEKGVLFRLYNKSMINALRAKERSLLRIACLAPSNIMA